MLLADAVREKDYLKSMLDDLANHISILKANSELEIVNDRLVEFSDIYQKYQQFSITVQRATSKAIIKVKDRELSVADAIVIRNILVEKGKHFKYIQEYTVRNGVDKSKLVDLDEIYKEMEKVYLDIKTLNSEIEYAFWNVEVS